MRTKDGEYRDLRPAWIRACDGLKNAHYMADGREAGIHIVETFFTSRKIRRDAERRLKRALKKAASEMAAVQAKHAARKSWVDKNQMELGDGDLREIDPA